MLPAAMAEVTLAEPHIRALHAPCVGHMESCLLTSASVLCGCVL